MGSRRFELQTDLKYGDYKTSQYGIPIVMRTVGDRQRLSKGETDRHTHERWKEDVGEYLVATMYAKEEIGRQKGNNHEDEVKMRICTRLRIRLMQNDSVVLPLSYTGSLIVIACIFPLQMLPSFPPLHLLCHLPL